MKLIKKLFAKFKREVLHKYTDRETFDYSMNLIRCSEIDFNTSKKLYSDKSKDYSVVLYHLQQSVEKLVKAELLMRKLIHRSQLKRIGHKTPMAFMLGLEKAMKDKSVNLFLSKLIPKNKIKEAWKIIRKPKKIINSKEDKLRFLMNYYKVFDSLKLPDKLYNDAKGKIDSKRIKSFDKERGRIFIELYFLSWITFPYAEITRYPDSKIKPWEYNQDVGIVKLLDDLMGKIEIILNYMKSYKF